MAARKTISVARHARTLQRAITVLGEQRRDDIDWRSQQAGLCWALERLLHDTGNYRGFQFADPDSSDVESDGYYDRRYYLPTD